MLSNQHTQIPRHEGLKRSPCSYSVNRFLLLLILGAISIKCMPSASAQSGFFSTWERRVNQTVAEQPAWPVPVATPPSGLVQLARFDAVRQITSTHTETWFMATVRDLTSFPGTKRR